MPQSPDSLRWSPSPVSRQRAWFSISAHSSSSSSLHHHQHSNASSAGCWSTQHHSISSPAGELRTGYGWCISLGGEGHGRWWQELEGPTSTLPPAGIKNIYCPKWRQWWWWWCGQAVWAVGWWVGLPAFLVLPPPGPYLHSAPTPDPSSGHTLNTTLSTFWCPTSSTRDAFHIDILADEMNIWSYPSSSQILHLWYHLFFSFFFSCFSW